MYSGRVNHVTPAISPDVLLVTAEIASELAAEGATAVVLAGSHARGEATDLSDIDLYAIGIGPPYALRVVRGRLVAVTWHTEDHERRALREPASVGEVVAAWRIAHAIHDRDGVAEGLKREAEAFDWGAVSAACDSWVADSTVGYAEEVLKLVAARHAGDQLLAAVQRSVLVLRLPRVMAVHQRLMYETENRLWHLVAEAMGDEWATAQAAALGLAASDDADLAALQLYTLAANEVRPLLTPAQAEVVNLALHAAVHGPK